MSARRTLHDEGLHFADERRGVGDCLVNENDVLKFGLTKEKMSDAVRARFTFQEHRFPAQEEGGDGFRTQPCPRCKLRAGAIGERGGISLHRVVTVRSVFANTKRSTMRAII